MYSVYWGNVFSRMPRRRPVGVAYPDWLRADICASSLHQTTRVIAKNFNVSQSTVSRVLNENASERSRRGPRPNQCILNQEDAAFLCLLKVSYPQASLEECKLALLIERGKDVSTSTISRELIRLGMTRKRLQFYSTRRDENRRVAWWTTPPHMGGCAGVDWSNLVDIDESCIKFGDSRRSFGHSLSGQPARVASFVSRLLAL